ncbi:hypothetical protein B0J15DRAFT_473365 [Fusarium solani]|uniref:Zn(2)-C6 fungal-type domain-containing protein n=1 Tax=Fusarium solani TaxID=169388 RepID=A0A9P9G1N7_FUSSL|nr:uncharacterized protein B0J15DRAFT_473365 [Fusarium solani]KAH7227240.1 hypothetical protein B0J15DRAFT_473365 [Fusarium solani]
MHTCIGRRRIRRVKCDEGRPACRRCVSTGRTCDGYGIWDNHQSRPPLPTGGGNSPLARPIVPISLATASDHERAGFEWFMAYTSTKMPGVFESKFWNSLVLQASWSEPAILQAVLALGAAHRRVILSSDDSGTQLSGCPDRQERALLQHYSRAISLLQPYLTVKSKENLRVVLISCIVFTCLEFLRQQYQTGHALPQNSLKLLNDIQPQCDEDGRGAILLKPEPASVEDLLVEEIARLDVQATLLSHGSCERYVVVSQPSSGTQPPFFRSVRVARQQLDTLLSVIHDLQNTSASPADNEESAQSIQAQLSSWLKTYEHPSRRGCTTLPWANLKL